MDIYNSFMDIQNHNMDKWFNIFMTYLWMSTDRLMIIIIVMNYKYPMDIHGWITGVNNWISNMHGCNMDIDNHAWLGLCVAKVILWISILVMNIHSWIMDIHNRCLVCFHVLSVTGYPVINLEQNHAYQKSRIMDLLRCETINNEIKFRSHWSKFDSDSKPIMGQCHQRYIISLL